MKPEIFIWLFPIVFMIHEFEEIIFIRWWLGKYKEPILIKFPKLGKRIIGQFDSFSTEAFSLIVAEEFLIASVIVIISALKNYYDLYFGLIIAYSVHLLIHLFQTLLVGRYTPAIVTTILSGIFCVYVINNFINSDLLSFSRSFIYSTIMIFVIISNLNLMHRVVKKIKILN